MSRVLLAVFCLLLVLPAAAQETEPWPEKIYNPAPLDDDLVLPLPCGGAMAFRPVAVPSEGWLADRKVVLGGVDQRFAHAENSRYAYIAGAFGDPETPARRVYYLAKYELMQAQWDAVMGDDCPKARQKGRLPAVELTWFDAVSFTQRYTEWLYRNAPEAVPAEDGVPGFVRLPTEAEWEYAARGGVAVPESTFLEAAFPMPDGTHKYAWFAGARSANGRLQLTGLLQANPLGLHDMLGNADEIVLEPFRLNKLARLHGQAGGFVVKGGNYFTSEGDLRAAYRQEVAHFTPRGPNRVKTIGTRVALSGQVLTSADRLEHLREAWAGLPETATVTSGTHALDDPVEELALITQATTDPDLRRRLEGLSLTLKATLAEGRQQSGRAARAMVRLGAFLGAKIRDDLRRVDAVAAILRGREEAGSGEELLAAARRSLETSRTILDGNLTYYADTVVLAARDYGGEILTREHDALAVEFESQGLDDLLPFAALYLDHTNTYRDSGTVDRDRFLEEIAAK